MESGNMESGAPAFMLPSFPISGFGATSWGDSWDMKTNESTAENGSAPVGLNLELGHGSDHSTKLCGFTVLQLQELQLQAFIYKYMEAALPVPYHLLLPLWKSVASSLGDLNDVVSSGHTSLLGSSPMPWDYRSSMDPDPEPGKCRRTDGKKWRCSKEAAPHKKYCERHMQRGRQRSRKNVEPSGPTNTSSWDAHSSSTNLSISLSANSSSSGSGTLSPILGFSSHEGSSWR